MAASTTDDIDQLMRLLGVGEVRKAHLNGEQTVVGCHAFSEGDHYLVVEDGHSIPERVLERYRVATVLQVPTPNIADYGGDD